MDPRLKPLIKDYFKYHIPFVLVSVVSFILAFAIGPRTTAGIILIVLGSASLLLAPPVSLIMVKRKHEQRLRRGEAV